MPTYRDIIASASKRLADAHIESAQLDAEILLAHVAQVSRLEIVLRGPKPVDLSKELIEAFNFSIARRQKHEPVAYILGKKEFCGIEFSVNKYTLIPRPDTEKLVEVALESALGKTGALIDVCTGSGCIAVSLKIKLPKWQVFAGDISPEAVVMARKNAARHHASIEFKEGNLLEPFSQMREVDMVVSNPPYIPMLEYEALMPDVKQFEPRSALLASSDSGVDFHIGLLKEALPILKEGGLLLMEIGFNQKEAIEGLSHLGYNRPRFHKDLSGNDRLVAFQKEVRHG